MVAVLPWVAAPETMGIVGWLPVLRARERQEEGGERGTTPIISLPLSCPRALFIYLEFVHTELVQRNERLEVRKEQHLAVHKERRRISKFKLGRHCTKSKSSYINKEIYLTFRLDSCRIIYNSIYPRSRSSSPPTP